MTQVNKNPPSTVITLPVIYREACDASKKDRAVEIGLCADAALRDAFDQALAAGGCPELVVHLGVDSPAPAH
jgi:hypothetical protein